MAEELPLTRVQIAVVQAIVVDTLKGVLEIVRDAPTRSALEEAMSALERLRGHCEISMRAGGE